MNILSTDYIKTIQTLLGKPKSPDMFMLSAPFEDQGLEDSLLAGQNCNHYNFGPTVAGKFPDTTSLKKSLMWETVTAAFQTKYANTTSKYQVKIRLSRVRGLLVPKHCPYNA